MNQKDLRYNCSINIEILYLRFQIYKQISIEKYTMNQSIGLKRLAAAISRSILKTDFHPIFYFAMIFLGLAQTFLCFLKPQTSIYNVFKWFDLSLYTDPRVLFYILFAPCFICAFSIVMQIFWVFSDTSLQTSIFKHYFIKITIGMGFFMSHPLCLTIIRCCVTMFTSPTETSQGLGVLIFLLYLLIIYPYIMFLLTDLSPTNKKIYSVCSFLNSLTLVHMYKPIAALMTSSHRFQYIMIPTGILFVILAISLAKLPILSWQYNKISQIMISCLIWMIMCRFVQMFLVQDLTVFVWVFGAPLFVSFSKWVLNRRVYSILRTKKNTVLKLKIIYFLVFNKKNYAEELSIFLLDHYKTCYDEECKCHLILEKMKQPELLNESNKSNQVVKYKFTYKSSLGAKSKIQQPKDALKISQKSKNQHSHEDASMVAWYQFLVSLQKSMLKCPKSYKLSSQGKDDKNQKGREILLDTVQILHFLGKQYQSLACMWQNESLYIYGFCSFFMVVRSTIQIFRQEETLQSKSQQFFFIRQALKFYQEQNQLINFKKIVRRAAKAVFRFWVQLSCEISDQKKILQYLKVFVQSRSEILVERKRIQALTQNKTQEGEQQKRKWSIESIMTFEEVYWQFKNALMLSDQMNQIRQTQSVKKNQVSNQQKFPKKDLKIFSFKQKTGIATVNIQEGPKFGLISMTNQSFWQLMGKQKYQKAEVNHFLMKYMQESHSRKMVNFLQQNKPSIRLNQIFVPIADHLILQLELCLHFLPNLTQGFFSVVYFQEVKSENALLVFNRSYKVLGYNLKFEKNFLKNAEINEYERAFTEQVFCKLSNQRLAKLIVRDHQIQLKVKRTINSEENIQENTLYYCEVACDSQEKDENQLFKSTKAICLQSKEEEGQSYENSGNKGQEKNGPKLKQQKSYRIRIHEIEEMENIKQLFDTLKRGKKSKNFKKWSKFVMMILIVGAVLAITTGSLSSVKYDAYTAASKIYGQLTFFTQHTARALFLTRKVNVVRFNNKAGELETVIENLYSLNDTLTNAKQSLMINEWKQLVISYNNEIGGQIVQEQISFDVTIQKNLLAPFTTYIQQSQRWGFDLTSDSGPVPTWQLTFSNMIMNCYYTILPKLHSEFRIFIENKHKNLIVLPVPLIPICMVVVALAISIQIVTISFHFKILHSVYSSLCLLTHLRQPFIKQRIESLRGYFAKSIQRGQEDISEVMKVQINMTHQVTTRNLRPQKQTSRGQKEDSNREVQMKVSPINKKVPILSIVLGLLPMMLIPASVVAYQAGQNSYIWGKLQLISLHHQLIENILYVNSYSYEFAYEKNSFKVQSITMSSEFANILEDVYAVSHKIQAAEAKQSADYVLFVQNANSLSFCDILQLACNQQECEKCDASFLSFYQQKSRNDVLVLFVETARSLLNNYTVPNMTRQMKQSFMLDPRHKELQKISQHLVSIENYKMKTIMANYNMSLKYYQIGIVMLCLAVVPVAFIIQMCWTGRKLEQMQREANIAKTIVEMITLKQTVANPSITQHITKNIQNYYMII